MRNRFALQLFGLIVVLMALVVAGLLTQPGGALARPALAGAVARPGNFTANATYTNPLTIVITGTNGRVESFADPSIIRAADGSYYAYATTDPLNDADRDINNNLIFHKMPIIRSTDLINWTYLHDVYTSTPSWTAPTAGLFAPDIHFFNGQYYLYYAATDVQDSISGEPNCNSDSAIGLATSPNPDGPWTDLGRPVVYPRRGGPGCNFFATIDPAISQDVTSTIIYFGSYYGGIEARRLSADLTTSDPATETQVAIPNRYEAAYVVQHGGFYYLFASATDCCRGPLTGYSVFAGRSASALGPFVDSRGIAMTETRVGGNVVISMNGNKWMGPGHNALITDLAGQDWFIYHAIDRGNPYFSDPNPYNVNKRPLMMDQLNWINGWPTVRSGYWASDTPQDGPVTQLGGTPTPAPTTAPRPQDMPGALQPSYSDEFNLMLGPQWGWVRQPPSTTYSLVEHPGYFRFRTQNADLYQTNNSASVLTETAPTGDFLVETKFEFNAPPSGCCFNYRQGGIVLYQDDDHYVKLDHASIWETRQTEWAKEVGVGDPDAARTNTYGNTVIGPPGQPGVMTTTTWLRIVKRTDQITGQQLYTGYSSFDGVDWERGATWTHNLSNLKIGLVSMAGSGFIADFDYVRVYTLQPNATETTTATATASTTGTPTSTLVPSVTTTGTSTAIATSTATQSATSIVTSTACPIQFTDVPPSNTFYPYVRCLACRGIVTGYQCGGANPLTGDPEPCDANHNPYFRYNNPITRGQISKLVANSAGFQEDPGAQIYEDVPPGSPFYDFINRLSHRSVMGGYTCGVQLDEPCILPGNRPYFRPSANASRGQLSKIVSNAAGFTEPQSGQTFEDVGTDAPFYIFVQRLATRGVMGGYPCGGTNPETGQAEPCQPGNRAYFRPGNTVTRGQSAKIVANTFFPGCDPR
ncbi:MAG: family 43 glycosylhydrolase [Chloroflexota bacterium]|nr:family 43 glycosylhydrolase [Chloroflexota bacterium]